MKQRSRVNGTEYTLLERLPVLGGEAAYILCVDNDGNRAVCPEELWCGGELVENQISSVNTHSSAQQKIDLFLSLFKGREDVYAKRYHSTKTGKSGYTTVCKNEWAYGLCDKKKYRCPDCPHREFLPLTAETVRAHLMGHDPLGRDVPPFTPCGRTIPHGCWRRISMKRTGRRMSVRSAAAVKKRGLHLRWSALVPEMARTSGFSSPSRSRRRTRGGWEVLC